ncbi:MAG: hypothetical protein P8O16_18800 [Algoriphagus sp.]|uniref:hypothetical protein n=1 Tax=Algoriphagus sp. TaxID=1872435 RepID=UPI00260D8891|nr:hypothetical protein [Algoriphagus sp.]MDG1279334.1 hypothetical protein [Algoriphagus sp.]
MRPPYLWFVFLFCGIIQSTFAQDQIAVKEKKSEGFKVEPSLEFVYRDFQNQTFLGDVYQMDLGYRLKLNFRYSNYPGIGIYVGGQGANVKENRFLAGFFKEARFRDHGILIYHKFPVGKKIAIMPDFGVGWMQVIHGNNPSKYVLNYNSYSGGLGFTYKVFGGEPGLIEGHLILRAGYGGLRGKDIIINPSDRSYVRESSELSGSVGFQITLH